jgi:putative SOS response-associated peptidase YedK
MKHNGSCDKTCGHMLSMMTVPYTQAVQRLLDRDPRVVEYREIDEDWLEVVYAPRRPVAATYYVAAMEWRIKELAGAFWSAGRTPSEHPPASRRPSVSPCPQYKLI